MFSVLNDVQECTPFGDWSDLSKKAVYYVHLWKHLPVIYPHIFIGQIVSYHGSVVKECANTFNVRLYGHKRQNTIDTEQENMTAILFGSKKSVKLVEALTHVLCKFFCMVYFT